MAQDIRKLFQNEPKVFKDKMPKGHEARFLKKLDEELPVKSTKSVFTFLNIAAGIVLLIGFSFGAYQFLGSEEKEIPTQKTVVRKSLGDLSPQFKKVEDYYLANINLELSEMKVTPESKELFDNYLLRLEELNKEYMRLEEDLAQSGPNEQTVNALIENLKLRLNLLYRLKEKLRELKGDLQGYWSRRVTSEHRLVYKYKNEELLIAACRYHYGK
jgi:Txe/YoeB family toxin of toxin-antitoxin system